MAKIRCTKLVEGKVVKELVEDTVPVKWYGSILAGEDLTKMF